MLATAPAPRRWLTRSRRWYAVAAILLLSVVLWLLLLAVAEIRLALARSAAGPAPTEADLYPPLPPERDGTALLEAGLTALSDPSSPFSFANGKMQ